MISTTHRNGVEPSDWNQGSPALHLHGIGPIPVAFRNVDGCTWVTIGDFTIYADAEKLDQIARDILTLMGQATAELDEVAS